MNVTYGGDPIPKTPFAVPIAPSLDLSKINVAGLGDSMLSENDFLWPFKDFSKSGYFLVLFWDFFFPTLTSEITVGKDQDITVKSKGAGGQGKVAAKVTGPSGKAVPCKVEPGLSPETSQVRFIPRDKGPYEVELTYDGAPIPGSPFPVEAVAPTDPSKVR